MIEAQKQESFVYFDGDDVGAKIELCLLSDDVEAAAAISTSVSDARMELSRKLQVRFDAELIFSAGDEVLARLSEIVDNDIFDQLRLAFAARSGISISCGVGRSASEASLNLRLAKLQGKNQTFGGRDV
ncbi:mCpol domain-containing protein [Rathayibacter sp. VKM Ac-2856]|uniref:mCpol domain-containing protein n=1 Tax=unclassified Rathayibacter TaxID=2609250 RepID=UPI00156441F5|nr:mCpol domain-containing protein [Rathayibacter sp. VKM Ac-2858]NQX18573.1 mCpol domain-containing protein [Rathayibacter sp. VKM Ac-2856]